MPTVPINHTDKEALKPVVIRMPAGLHEAVKKKAATEDRSMASAIRYALRTYAEGR
jgi:hypothetical protein